MLQLEPRHQKIVQQIIKKYPYIFYAYGSRVKGNAYRFSDLDICYQEEIPDNVIFQITEEFEESDLPFFVELVNWKNMSSEFQSLIRKDLTPL